MIIVVRRHHHHYRQRRSSWYTAQGEKVLNEQHGVRVLLALVEQ